MLIGPYGDASHDGKMQLSFTLPLAAGGLAREAARQLCAKMGFPNPHIAHMQHLAEGFTFFIVYVQTHALVDVETLRPAEPSIPAWSKDEVDEALAKEFETAIPIVGACTGTDSHTVGLDAILNRKGTNGVPGLESYRAFRVHNLGSQISNEDFVDYARLNDIRVLLISQVVTEKDRHLENLRELAVLLEGTGYRDELLVIIGGPRVVHATALELGFDAGFGAGTTPDQVAAFIARWCLERKPLQTAGIADPRVTRNTLPVLHG